MHSMNFPPWTTAFGEDGPPDRELAHLICPVANIFELKEKGVIQICCLLQPSHDSPQWLIKLREIIEVLNRDIASDTVEFPSFDLSRATIMRNFSIDEQIAIVGKIIRSQMKGLVSLERNMPTDLME